MLTSLALVFLVGLALAALCQKLKLPRIIGMLATGILLGPCVLNVLDGSILSISADLRKLALVIILLKAGLSLDLGDLKKVGRPAILMSCLPATCEIIGYVLLAPCFLGVTHTGRRLSWARCSRRCRRGRRAAHGAADGKRPRNGQEHPADDPGRRIVRRYLRHCAVYNVSAHGAGRQRQRRGLFEHPCVDRARRCAGCACRVVAQPLFRDCLCPIALHPQQHEGHHRAGGLAAARRGGGLARRASCPVSGLLAVVSMACLLKMKCTPSLPSGSLKNSASSGWRQRSFCSSSSERWSISAIWRAWALRRSA